LGKKRENSFIAAPCKPRRPDEPRLSHPIST
jgi:hypothetical protein